MTPTKKTVEIADPLLIAAKRLARQRSTTMKAIFEAALRKLIEAESEEKEPFQLRDGSVGGEGLHEDRLDGDWESVRDLIYEERGS